MSSESTKPAFIITVDTEPDNLWDQCTEIKTENIRFLQRFHDLCIKNGFRPTYLVDYDIAQDPRFINFGRSILAGGQAEIGMHLHAWLTPPFTDYDKRYAKYKPYLIEYDEPTMDQKIANVDAALSDALGIKALSHRAGRWAFNESYLQAIERAGYLVDCSVTPHIALKDSGTENAFNRVSYEGFPENAYFMDSTNISQKGSSKVMEIPVTIIKPDNAFEKMLRKPFRRIANKVFPIRWLRPTTDNIRSMIGIVDYAIHRERPYVEFMIHSSELMPGGSPYFPDENSIEKLYSNLSSLFSYCKDKFVGLTLTEYRRKMELQ